MSNEKDMMLGTCRFCGQRKMVQAMSEAVANEVATSECNCEEGESFRKKEACLDRIAEICKAPKNEAGVTPLSEDLAVFVRGIADRVAIKSIESATIEYMGTVIKLRPGTEEKPVKFSRSWKLEIEN